MKASESAKLVMMLMAAFPNGKTSEATSKVYEEMLADLDFAAARRAVTNLIRTAKFLPTVAEIREATGLVKRELGDHAAVRARRLENPTPYGTGDVKRLLAKIGGGT